MFDRSFSLFKIFFVLVFLLIIGSILFRVNMYFNAKNSGKAIYEIHVNRLNESESYMTSEYTRDKETGCISFKDEFGIKRIVCNDYTITEY